VLLSVSSAAAPAADGDSPAAAMPAADGRMAGRWWCGPGLDKGLLHSLLSLLALPATGLMLLGGELSDPKQPVAAAAIVMGERLVCRIQNV
jgi:hypothetical protein